MTLSNTQADQAEEIKALVAESDVAHLTSIEKALEAGHRLVAAKADCQHGTWLPFLERAGVQERKAQRLMKLARSGLKSVTVSDLGGIKKALQFLSRRTLPAQGKCLEITAKAAGVITAIGALWPSVEHPGFYYCAVMQHSGGEEGSSPVVWTRRPVRGEPLIIPGDGLYEPVWTFFETHMGAPSSMWEYEEDGVMPEVLAFRLDIPYLVAGAENHKSFRDADSEVVADFLESAGITPHYQDWSATA